MRPTVGIGALIASFFVSSYAVAAPSVAADLQALTGASCTVPRATLQCVANGRPSPAATAAFNRLITDQVPQKIRDDMRATLNTVSVGSAPFTLYKGPSGADNLIGGMCSDVGCNVEYMIYKIDMSGAIGITLNQAGKCQVIYMSPTYAETSNIC